MNSNLIKISTAEMSREEWLQYRNTGIGASEVGAVLGLSPYKSSIELFYEKIGMYPKTQPENLAMFMGSELEEFVADKWQYWDGTAETMIANFRAGNKVRKCRRINAYLRNPKYPHLFVSLDRIINKQGGKDEGALEIKTIGGFEANKWEAGIPPSHVVQLQTQLLVSECEYGELACLIDGRKMEVFSFDPHADIMASIAERTAEFWKRVTSARPIVEAWHRANKEGRFEDAELLRVEIEMYEPEADGSAAYTDYLKERYKNPSGERLGSAQEKEWAGKALEIAAQVKSLEEQKNEYDNLIKRSMGDVSILDFGACGRITWLANSKGTRVFNNRLKLD